MSSARLARAVDTPDGTVAGGTWLADAVVGASKAGTMAFVVVTGGIVAVVETVWLGGGSRESHRDGRAASVALCTAASTMRWSFPGGGGSCIAGPACRYPGNNGVQPGFP